MLKSTGFVTFMLPLLICLQHLLVIKADPTAEPSTSPYATPSARPSDYPSVRPTARPSKYPSAAPITSQIGLLTMVTEGITINMNSVNPLNEDGTKWFQNKLSEYILNYFQNGSEYSYVGLVQVDVKVTEMDPPFGAAASAGGSLLITYDQKTTYRVLEEENVNSITPKLFVVEPLESLKKREDFVNYIVTDDGSGISTLFSNLNEITQPVLYTNPETSSTIIIAASVGGTVLLLLVGAILYCRKRKRDKFYNQDAANYNPKNMTPGHVQLPVLNDEISTLDDPSPQYGVFQSNKSLQGYGNRSVGTMDPDYVGVYGGAADNSVISSAGGTLGDATRQSTKSILPSVQGGGGEEGVSVFTDDEQSFEAFRIRNNYAGKEEVIEIFAPAGKLGVVIDTPANQGAPVVYNIKDTCPIADKLRVGDKLIAVDDEDVTSFTAVKVSKIISQKSGNAQRKFTIVRSIGNSNR